MDCGVVSAKKSPAGIVLSWLGHVGETLLKKII